MPTPISSHYLSKLDFDNTLKALATAKTHHKIALKDNKLIRVHQLSTNYDSSPKPLADHFIEFIKLGSARSWIQHQQFPLIEKIAHNIGVIPSHIKGESAYRALGQLILDSVAPPIASKINTRPIIQIMSPKQSISFENLLKLIRETPITHQRPTTDVTLQAFEWLMGYPYNPDSVEGIDVWVYEIFLLGEMQGLAQEYQAEDRLAGLDKIGFQNAFALLANAYRLAYFVQKAKMMGQADKMNWLAAGEIYLTHLKGLVEKYPDELKLLLQQSPLPLMFNKEAVDDDFKILWDRKLQEEQIEQKKNEDEEEAGIFITVAAIIVVANVVYALGSKIFSHIPTFRRD